MQIIEEDLIIVRYIQKSQYQKRVKKYIPWNNKHDFRMSRFYIPHQIGKNCRLKWIEYCLETKTGEMRDYLITKVCWLGPLLMVGYSVEC